MGLTPLDGLPGGSRSGSVDPSLIFHYSSRPSDTDKVPPSVELSHAENILNSSSVSTYFHSTEKQPQNLSKETCRASKHLPAHQTSRRF